MTQTTAMEFQRKFGEFQHKAQREPVEVNRGLGMALIDPIADRFLRAEVGIGDQVEAGFLAHLEVGPPLLQHGRAAAGGFLGGFEVVG